MNQKKIVISLLFAAVLIKLFMPNIWDKNAKLLKERIISIEGNDKTMDLSAITPFEWDVAYSFSPYTPKAKIYDVIGYKWDNIKETVSAGMTQIVFLKDGKVVCYLYGYPANNGYDIIFTGNDYKNVATILKRENNLKFKVTRSDDVIYLKQIK